MQSYMMEHREQQGLGSRFPGDARRLSFFDLRTDNAGKGLPVLAELYSVEQKLLGCRFNEERVGRSEDVVHFHVHKRQEKRRFRLDRLQNGLWMENMNKRSGFEVVKPRCEWKFRSVYETTPIGEVRKATNDAKVAF